MFPNRIAVTVAFPAFALTWKGVPEEKTAPRGEFALKKLAGRLFGDEKASGTASQLISRWPDGNVPPTPLLVLPRSLRNWSTTAWIEAGETPAAVRTMAPPRAIHGTDARRARTSNERRNMVPPSRLRRNRRRPSGFRSFHVCKNCSQRRRAAPLKYPQGRSMADAARPAFFGVVNALDFRDLARRRLPRVVFDYLDGGAEGEVTLRENCRAFEEIRFRPWQAVTFPKCDMSVNVLGT